MKSLLCTLCCCLTLMCACNDSSDSPCPDPTPSIDDNYFMLTQYYIGQYVSGEIGFSVIKQENADYPGQRLDDGGLQIEIIDPVYYQDPFFKVAQNGGKFMWIAKHNGDFCENGFETMSRDHSKTIALEYNIESIDVTSNKAWDAAHPAGTSLNDIIKFSAVSYADYIDANYNEDRQPGDDSVYQENVHSGILSESTADDMRVLRPDIEFFFLKSPDVTDEHTLEFRFKTSLSYNLRSREQIVKVTCIPTRFR